MTEKINYEKIELKICGYEYCSNLYELHHYL